MDEPRSKTPPPNADDADGAAAQSPPTPPLPPPPPNASSPPETKSGRPRFGFIGAYLVVACAIFWGRAYFFDSFPFHSGLLDDAAGAMFSDAPTPREEAACVSITELITAIETLKADPTIANGRAVQHKLCDPLLAIGSSYFVDVMPGERRTNRLAWTNTDLAHYEDILTKAVSQPGSAACAHMSRYGTPVNIMAIRDSPGSVTTLINPRVFESGGELRVVEIPHLDGTRSGRTEVFADWVHISHTNGRYRAEGPAAYCVQDHYMQGAPASPHASA